MVVLLKRVCSWKIVGKYFRVRVLRVAYALECFNQFFKEIFQFRVYLTIFFSLDKILRQNSELFIQGAFTSRSVSMSNAINQLDQFIYYRVVCKSMCGHAEIIISSNHSMTKWHTVFVCVKQQLDKMSCIIRNICNRKIQKKFEQKNDTTKHDWIR